MIKRAMIIPLYNQEILDMDDLVFYEVVIEKREDDAYLITGNIRHFQREISLLRLQK